jgi:hypothetical protein
MSDYIGDYVNFNTYQGKDYKGGTVSLSGLREKKYEKLVSPKEFAQLSGLTLIYVRNLCSRGEIRCLRVGPKKFLLDPEKAFADLGRLIDTGKVVQCTYHKPAKVSRDASKPVRRRGRPPKEYLSAGDKDEKRKLKAIAG